VLFRSEGNGRRTFHSTAAAEERGESGRERACGLSRDIEHFAGQMREHGFDISLRLREVPVDLGDPMQIAAELDYICFAFRIIHNAFIVT
jgi:hypothetical protein